MSENCLFCKIARREIPAHVVHDDEDSFAFLDRRIDNVMQIEKVKYQAKQRTEFTPSLSRFIGRLRYPAR